ncbi:hypothetical protein B0H21DRAFT_821697 [Amylocystis lapponica]|nr:hypothetical protein B0H21DRAFT_821697 [Amylocystis lapponica]
MELTFSPALDAFTPIKLIPQPGFAQDLIFKATFSSRAAHDQARREGVRVEMWTDLPVAGRALGEWGALAFQMLDHASVAREEADSDRVLEMSSQDQQSGSAADEQALHVTLPLALCDRAPTKFSYTYRLVYPSGSVRWLGQYGQNGVIIVERGYPGLNLGAGWRDSDDGSCLLESGAEETEVGELSGEMEWSSCRVGRDSWPVFSSTTDIALSPAVVLFPRHRVHAHSIVLPQPLVLSATSGTSVRISPSGHIYYISGTEDGRLSLRVLDGLSVDVFTSQVLGLGLNDRHITVEHESESSCILVASRSQGAQCPVALSAIPLRSSMLPIALHINNSALADLLSNVSSEQYSLYAPLSRKGLFVASTEDINVTLHVGPAGGQAILAPAHILVVPRGPGKGTWGLSLLTSHSSLSVVPSKKKADVETEDMPSRILPTPPPSPPPVRVAPVTPAIPSAVPHQPALPSIASVLAIPGGLPRSASTASISSAASVASNTSILSTSSVPISPARSSARTALALVRTNTGPTRPYWMQALLAVLSLLWRVFLRRLVIIWIGAGGTPLGRKGGETVGGDSKTFNGPGESEETEEPKMDHAELIGIGVEESASHESEDAEVDLPSPLDAPTPHVVTPLPLRSELVGILPSLSVHVRDVKGGTIAMLVRVPTHTAPTALKLALDGNRISELRLSGLCAEDMHLFEVGVDAVEGRFEVSFVE